MSAVLLKGIAMNLFDKIFHRSTMPSRDCDYIIFDLETSSLSVSTCEIIEVGAVKVLDGEIVDSFSSLICPQKELDPAAMEVNLIPLDDLYSAPAEEDVMPDFFKFIGDHTLSGYNIKVFDMPILRRYARKYDFDLSNDVDDVLPLARRKLGFLKTKTLPSVAAYFKIDTSCVHRSVADCKITLEVSKKLVSLPNYHAPSQVKKYDPHYTKETYQLNELGSLISGIMSDGRLDSDEIAFLDNWLKTHEGLKGNYPFDRIYAVLTAALEDGVVESAEAEELITLFQKFIDGKLTGQIEGEIDIAGKHFVLTGEFEFGERDFVIEKLESMGGINAPRVSSKTDYLIVGAFGSADWSAKNYGTKIKRAKELQQSGKQIIIVSENDFFKHLKKS